MSAALSPWSALRIQICVNREAFEGGQGRPSSGAMSPPPASESGPPGLCDPDEDDFFDFDEAVGAQEEEWG